MASVQQVSGEDSLFAFFHRSPTHPHRRVTYLRFLTTTSRELFFAAMDPAYQNKKIVDLSDEELNTLEFLGKNVAPGVKAMVEKVRTDPVHLGTVTCFMVDCLNRTYSAQAPPQDGSVTNTVG